LSRFPVRLLCLAATALALTRAPTAQPRAQNDKAAADAVKNQGLPLITDRNLSFTTSEAISPDGSKLVFVSDRNGSENIWVSNANGTKPRDHDHRAREWWWKLEPPAAPARRSGS